MGYEVGDDAVETPKCPLPKYNNNKKKSGPYFDLMGTVKKLEMKSPISLLVHNAP